MSHALNSWNAWPMMNPVRFKILDPVAYTLLIDCSRKGSLCILVLTGLVGNTAAGLACALAGCLALAAAAVLSTLRHITGIQCLNMLHILFLLSLMICHG